MPTWAWAGFWGGVAGSALLIGAAAAWFLAVPRRAIAAIMAFGAGVLISALAFDLMDEAYASGGFDSTSFGFLAGAVIYTGATFALNRRGGKRRKRSKDQPSDVPLNPALKSERETVYPTRESSPAPIDTTSATENEGEGWPVIWLIVTIVGVALAIYFVL